MAAEQGTRQLSVSIVVIVLNGEATIQACLESLLTQDVDPGSVEIIVVDNDSQDRTPELVRQFPVRLVHEPVRGYAPARNAGVRAAQGEIIAFTDADCVAEPDWLSKLLRHFSDPQVGIVGGNIAAYPSEKPTLVEKFITSGGFVGPPKRRVGGVLPYVTTASVAYRAALLRRAGMFDVSLPSCEDVDLSRKVQVELGAQAVLEPGALVYHHHYHTLRGFLKLMRRNGEGEMIMAARWKNVPPFETSLRREAGYMLRQFGSILVYCAALLRRFPAWILRRISRDEFARPFLWLVGESATLLGKFQGLGATRGLTFIPRRVWHLQPGNGR